MVESFATDTAVPRSGRRIFDSFMRLCRGHRAPQPPTALDHLRQPSKKQFRAYQRASRPAFLEGIFDNDRCVTGWSLETLRQRFGARVATVIPISDQRLHCDVRNGVEFRTMRFGDYVDLLEGPRPPEAYLVTPAETLLPELVEAIPAPEYCRDAPWRASRLWLSAAHTSSPLHHDVADNIFVQLIGRKRFYLYPPSASPWLYSHGFFSGLPNYSAFDPEQPDFERFPLCREVRPLEIILNPGDAMYLPSRWWHQVRSLDVSASFNFWFASGALALLVRSAELVKRRRKLEIYGLGADPVR